MCKAVWELIHDLEGAWPLSVHTLYFLRLDVHIFCIYHDIHM